MGSNIAPCSPPPGNSPIQLGNSLCWSFSPLQLPGDTCIDTAERKIRHSEELHFSPFCRPQQASSGTNPPGHFWCSQAAASGISVGHPPSPRQDTWGWTQAALHRLNPRLDHLRSAFLSHGKASGRNEHSGAATLGTLGSILEHPTPRNP